MRMISRISRLSPLSAHNHSSQVVSLNLHCGCLIRKELFTHWEPLGSPRFFGRVHVADLIFVCVVFIFLSLRPVSCVPDVANVPRLFILVCPFGFLYLIFLYQACDIWKNFIVSPTYWCLLKPHEIFRITYDVDNSELSSHIGTEI